MDSTKEPSYGFNTQPPEGGWVVLMVMGMVQEVFQHTAA